MTCKHVGIVGLGRMGMPLARNLLASGFAVSGFRRGGAQELLEAGGTACESPAEVAARCDIVITVLPNDAALEEVISGPVGIASSRRRRVTVIELSTLSLAVKRTQRRVLQDHGADMLDAPMSGIPAMAAARQVMLFASGDESVYRRCKAVLEGMTDAHRYLGEFGLGLKMKYISNLLVGVHSMATAEAMALAVASGFKPGDVAALVAQTAAGSQVFAQRAPLMVERRYLPSPGPISSLLRQMLLIRDFAGQAGAPTPLLDVTVDYFQRASRDGFDEQDAAALFEILIEERNQSAPAS